MSLSRRWEQKPYANKTGITTYPLPSWTDSSGLAGPISLPVSIHDPTQLRIDCCIVAGTNPNSGTITIKLQGCQGQIWNAGIPQDNWYDIKSQTITGAALSNDEYLTFLVLPWNTADQPYLPLPEKVRLYAVLPAGASLITYTIRGLS